MSIPRPLLGRLRTTSSVVMTAVFVVLCATSRLAYSQSARLAIASPVLDPSTSAAVDIGALPVSQPMQVTLRLAPSADRTAALQQFLADQITSSSNSFHQWLTPQQFAASYGATDDQISTVTSYLQAQGLTVESVSPAKTRLTVSGTVAQVQSAFAAPLRSYVISGNSYYGTTATPTLPRSIASSVAGISGLSTIPTPTLTISSVSQSGVSKMIAASSQASDALASAASAVDANSAPILTINTTACSTDLTQADYDNYRALLQQANAQGMTIIATNGCGTRGTGSFPASLSEVTAITTATTTEPFVAIDPRPAWQAASGLPNDGSRDEPDLTTSSLTDFSNAIATIVQQDGGRQGNINGTLYDLAPTPDLYTQPDDAPAGTWESATGLGTVNLNTLIKVYPRTSGISTTTSLTASSYSVTYGTSVTLTSTVTPSSYASANPSGTVTFTGSSGTIGSAALNNGTATYTVSNLAVGTYSVTANYSGDSNYAASTSTSSVVITVSIANATISATIAPTTNVPYGSTATVTATVGLSGSAAPSGTVSAVVEGVTGSAATATLSPNPGGNTATANININAPQPQTAPYTVQVTCTGNQNFQCQSPANVTFTTAKGNTTTTVSLTPAAPQAGTPVTITATVNNNGNGTGTYTFSGNIVFYDNGTLLATVPVATNQASTSKTLSGAVLHSITAVYSGDSNWNGNTSTPVSVTPTLLPATVSITANTTNTLAGANVSFTATVYTTATNAVGPTGTVSFYDTFNSTVALLGTPTLVSNGPNQSIAIFTTTGLQAGTHSVYAIYSGDSNFSTATSSTYGLTVSDFNLTFEPQTLTLTPGQSGQVVVFVGALYGFTGTVSFGCTPPSNSETTCSFSPVTLSGGGSTTLTIVTTAATASSSKNRRYAPFNWGGVGGSVVAVLVWFAAPRRRRAVPTLLAVIAAICLTANIGCGLGGTPSSDPTPGDPGTPLGTQMFTLTAAGSDGVNTVRHTYNYQVTIQ
jgi:hypothetical protein